MHPPEHRVFKRKHLNPTSQFLVRRPHSSLFYSHHPQHTTITEILFHKFPFYQNTSCATTNDNQLNFFVDEHALFPTLSWTTYYRFTNPLSLPLKNNPEYNELCQSRPHELTTPLYGNQFTTIGLIQTLNRFIAPRANRFSINLYNHAITRYMEDNSNKDDPNTNPPLTEKF